jgi:hypothetical protein
MIKLFSLIKAKPSILGLTSATEILGKAFALMLNNGVTSDDDTIEAIAGIAYVFTTKAILQNPNPNLFMNRLLKLEFSREQFNYSIQSAIDVREGSISFFDPVGQLAGIRARDAIFKMEIADLYTNPVLYKKVDFFNRKNEKFDEMISDNFFHNETLTDLITEGTQSHAKVYKYLHHKIIIEQDIDA